MTAIPGIAVFEVRDANQAKRILDYSLNYNGPIYIRSSVEPTLEIYDENIEVTCGGSTKIMAGEDGAFLCSGVTVQYALEAAKQIEEETGKKISVVDMYSIKPIDREAVISAAKTGRVVVAQDHNIIGGLGSLVSTVIAESGIAVKFKILGIDDCFVAMAHAKYLYSLFENDANGLKNNMLKLLAD